MLENADEQTLHFYQTTYKSSGWQRVLRLQAEKISENQQSYRQIFFIAALYAQIGDKDETLEILEKSYQRREFWMVYLQTEPRLDSLRDDPRFVELVRKVEAK